MNPRQVEDDSYARMKDRASVTSEARGHRSRNHHGKNRSLINSPIKGQNSSNSLLTPQPSRNNLDVTQHGSDLSSSILSGTSRISRTSNLPLRDFNRLNQLNKQISSTKEMEAIMNSPEKEEALSNMV